MSLFIWSGFIVVYLLIGIALSGQEARIVRLDSMREYLRRGYSYKRVYEKSMRDGRIQMVKTIFFWPYYLVRSEWKLYKRRRGRL